ncbi:hypothetical protein Cpir12675_006858 [Ceratocystis pirilliformis]|uniref:DUF1279 domain-containing protein n=1 Tax=Ceratocystis pirilliformis TaxID=259994 RepID=A0ABR3YFK7_9PEZI
MPLTSSPALRLARFRINGGGLRYSSSTPRSPSTSTSSTPTAASTTTASTASTSTPVPRWKRIPFVASMSSQPVTSTISFLVLHELTAVVPLVGITACLQYTDPVPLDSLNKYLLDAFSQGLDKFGQYFAKKRWFGFELDAEGKVVGGLTWEEGDRAADGLSEEAKARYKLLSNVALAYALTKLLLPVRIYVSALATPWFANIMKKVGSLCKLGKKNSPKP